MAAKKETVPASPFWSLGVEDEALWEELAAGRLVVQRCRTCATWIHPPTVACENCLSTDLGLDPVEGPGEVLGWMRMHLSYLEDWPPPYVVAAVALDEGPIIMCAVTGDPPSVGDRGRVVPYEAPSGKYVHRYVAE